jgi:hypothetical protein
LRASYRDARCLRHTDLYGLAQLARIADKAEYFLHQWPAAHWPAGSHLIASGPVQAGSAGLATVKRESLSGGTWPYPRWREAQNALLAVLVPFA